jgi:excisionase family DNA binding protein
MCPVPSTLLTVEDLAQRLGVTARTIRRWRLAGQIPRGIELGDSVIRWPADVIDRFLAEGGAA